MRSILSIASCLLLASGVSLYAQAHHPTYEEKDAARIRGEKISLRTEIITEKDGTDSIVERFDTTGFVLRREEYRRGELRLVEIREYNTRGWLISREERNGAMELQQSDRYAYDSSGNRVLEERFDDDGQRDYRWEYRYDEDGNQVEWRTYNGDGSPMGHTYTYSLERRTVESASYSEDGKLLRKTFYTYDSRGRNTSVKSYDSKGKRTEHWIYTFKGDGEGATRLDWDYPSGGKGYTKFTFDEKDRQKESLIYKANGSLESRIRYSYNERGLLAEQITTGPSGKTQKVKRYRYEFYR